jgi:hypothetical protein
VHVATRPAWNRGSHAEALGDAGHVVGKTLTASGQQAWVWDGGGPLVVRGSINEHHAVNARGAAVGYRTNDTVASANYANQAYLFDGMTGRHLDPLPLALDRSSEAFDINVHGVAVGYAEDAAGVDQAVLWDRDGRVTRLPGLPGQVEGHAVAVNDAGVVVGQAETEDYLGPVRWKDGAVEALEDLYRVHDLSEDGTVLGETVTGAVRWTDEGSEPLQPLSTGESVDARHLNDNGDVVGMSGNEPVLWPAGSTAPVRLEQLVDDPGMDVGRVLGIDDDGQILISATKDGVHASWLMRPASQPPHLSDVSVEHPAVPSGEWVDVPPAGTVDGNRVRLRTTVRNPSGKAQEVRLIVEHGSEVLTKAPLAAVVPARGSADIPLEWDSTGSAWEDGAPAAPEQFTVRLFVDGQEVGARETTLVVRPRPLVLVHGFNADASTWSAYPTSSRGCARTGRCSRWVTAWRLVG